MRSAYVIGLDILGDAGSGGAPSLPTKQVYYGPESPADLAKADRVLNAAEQKAVDDFQSKQADAYQAAEEKKGGPKAATVTVTPKGAVIKAAPVPVTPESPFPWTTVLIGLGITAMGLGVYMAVRDK